MLVLICFNSDFPRFIKAFPSKKLRGWIDRIVKHKILILSLYWYSLVDYIIADTYKRSYKRDLRKSKTHAQVRGAPGREQYDYTLAPAHLANIKIRNERGIFYVQV